MKTAVRQGQASTTSPFTTKEWLLPGEIIETDFMEKVEFELIPKDGEISIFRGWEKDISAGEYNQERPRGGHVCMYITEAAIGSDGK